MRVVLSLLVCSCFWGYSATEADVELTFYPPGEDNTHKQGEYVKVICRAKKEILDLLQVMKDVDGTKHEISTNNLLKATYKNTNRYALLSTNEGGYQETHIAIQNVQGEDSGQFECWHTLLDQSRTTAVETFKVLVPPESVQIMQYISTDVSNVANDGKIILREGEDHGIICQVKVAGSDDSPTVDITLDGQSITNRFTKTEDKTMQGEGGLQQRNITVVYEYLTQHPSIEDNGKTLTCSAATRGYDAISRGVTLEVHYAPRLECDAVEGVLGQSAEITCRGNMFPEVELASFSWTRLPDRFSIDLDNQDHERHHLEMIQEADGKYKFVVTIDEVQENDFGRYLLEVQNAHSPSEQEVELVKGAVTPAPTPAPTDPPYKVTSDGPGKPRPPEPSTGLAHRPISSILSIVLALIIRAHLL